MARAMQSWAVGLGLPPNAYVDLASTYRLVRRSGRRFWSNMASRIYDGPCCYIQRWSEGYAV